MKKFLSFALKVIVVHVVTYFVAGAFAYPLWTKQFYEAGDRIFAAFMRTPLEPELWSHVMKWFLLGQVLRGLLIALALYPFMEVLLSWSYKKRALSISGLYLVLGFWAAAVAAPGTIDGMIYLRPEITSYAHLMVQPEIIIQGGALGLWLAWWMGAKRKIKVKGQE